MKNSKRRFIQLVSLITVLFVGATILAPKSNAYVCSCYLPEIDVCYDSHGNIVAFGTVCLMGQGDCNFNYCP